MRRTGWIAALIALASLLAACDPSVTDYASTSVLGDLTGKPEGYLLVAVSHQEQYVVMFGPGRCALERVTRAYSVGRGVTVHEFACGAFVTTKRYNGIAANGWKQASGLLLLGSDAEDLEVTPDLNFNHDKFGNVAQVLYERGGWPLNKVFPKIDFEQLKTTHFCD